MNYDKFLITKMRKSKGFILLAVPIIGWFVALSYFCIIYPLVYLYEKEPNNDVPVIIRESKGVYKEPKGDSQ